MNDRVVTPQELRSSKTSGTNCRYYSIPNQWGIVEAEMTTKFRPVERNIPALCASTIHLEGIAYPQEEKVEMTDHHEEGNSSFHRTCD